VWFESVSNGGPTDVIPSGIVQCSCGGLMSTDYTMHASWVIQRPPMAVKVAMAKQAIEQGLTKDMFVRKNMEGVTDLMEYDWFGQDWGYAYSLAKEELSKSGI